MHLSATMQTSALTVTQKRSFETFYRAFSDKNPSLLDEAVTLDWQDIPLAPGQGAGPEGLKPLMQLFFTALPDVRIIIDGVIAQPARAGVRARMVATHRGEIFGLLPTGKPVLLGGTLASALVAFLYDGQTATAMTSVMTLFALASFAAYANIVRPAEKRLVRASFNRHPNSYKT